MTRNEHSLYIGGRWLPAENGEIYSCLDPYTGEVASRAAATKAR